ncbi:hypothetical protein Hanom_Chr03g00240401 [Helianthus anomalus]
MGIAPHRAAEHHHKGRYEGENGVGRDLHSGVMCIERRRKKKEEGRSKKEEGRNGWEKKIGFVCIEFVLG